MNLYLLRQDTNNDYDTYDSCVVSAETEDDARLILPADYVEWEEVCGSWADKPEQVLVELIGEAIDGTEAGVVVASFNAG